MGLWFEFMRWSLCDNGLHIITKILRVSVIFCDFCTIVEACDAMEGCRVVRKACDPTFASGLSKISNLQTGLAEMSKWQNWNIYAERNTEILSKYSNLERSAKLRLENSICWHQQGPGEKSRRNSILSFIWYSTRHLAQNLAKYLSFNLESKFKQRRKLTTRNMSIVDWAPLSSPLCLSVCLCPQTVSSHQYDHHHYNLTHIGW